MEQLTVWKWQAGIKCHMWKHLLIPASFFLFKIKYCHAAKSSIDMPCIKKRNVFLLPTRQLHKNTFEFESVVEFYNFSLRILPIKIRVILHSEQIYSIKSFSNDIAAQVLRIRRQNVILGLFWGFFIVGEIIFREKKNTYLKPAFTVAHAKTPPSQCHCYKRKEIYISYK